MSDLAISELNDFLRDGPAQTGIPDFYGQDSLVFNMRTYSPAGGLYFRQLRHE